jgi:hypothetical protein
VAWVIALVGLAILAALHEGVLRLAAKKWRHAIAIPIAVVAHYLLIAAIAFGYCVHYGLPTGAFVTSVADVVDTMPAAGKLQRGDVVRTVDGKPLEYGLSDQVNRAGGRPVVIGIEREGKSLEVTIEPRFDDKTRRYLLGVKPKIDPIVDRDPAVAARVGLLQGFYAAQDFVKDTRELVAGSDEPVPGGPKRIYDEIPRDVPLFMAALAFLANASILALLVQTVIDVVRARRR